MFSERLDDFLVRYLGFFHYRNYVRRMNFCGSEKVLEVGCGGGNLSRFISEELPNGKLVSIDISDYWISKARGRDSLDRTNFKVGKFEEAKLDNFSFNCAIVHYVFHDVPVGERRYFLSCLMDKVKLHGLVYMREPTRKSHGINPDILKKLMIDFGFKEVSFEKKYSLLFRSYCEGIFMKN